MKKFIISLMLISPSCFAYNDIENEICKLSADFMEQIIIRAETKYPNDYSMQRHEIESESKSFLQIREYKRNVENLRNRK